jgi:ADP-ribose pyrophosphatase YjhB (NUDIX family)
MNKKPDWLSIARTLQSIGQTGLNFTKNKYDIERYQQLLNISSEIIENLTHLDRNNIIMDFKNQKGYATPKIDIRGAIIKNNKILLVQEIEDKLWSLPGGWADIGESPSEAIKREILEETGLNVSVENIIGIYDANTDGRDLSLYHAYKIVFLCESITGELKTSNETIAVEYFERDKIPELSESRTHSRHLNDIFKYLENEKTKFD